MIPLALTGSSHVMRISLSDKTLPLNFVGALGPVEMENENE